MAVYAIWEYTDIILNIDGNIYKSKTTDKFKYFLHGQNKAVFNLKI